MNLPRVALALAFGLLVANGVRADNLLNVIVFDGAAAVKEGDAAPDTGGGVFGRGLGDPSFDVSGGFAFRAPVSGGSVTEGIFLHAGGVTTKLVLPGDPAPDTSGTFASFTEVSRNASGDLALIARYTGGVAGSSQVQALFLLSTAGDVRIAQSSDAAPGGDAFFAFSAVELADSGEVAFRASLGSPPSGVGLYLYSSGAIRKVARNGEVAPGTGGNFTNAFGAPALVAPGDVVFGGVSTAGTTAVFHEAGAGVLAVAVAGGAAPGGTTYVTAGTPVDGSGGGDAAFPAILSMGAAIVRDTAGLQTAIAAQGVASPAGATFGNLSDSDPALSPSGVAAFVAPLTSPSPTWGVFVRSGATTTAVALSGDQVPNSGGAYYGGPVPASLVPATLQVDDTGRTAFAVTLTKDADLDADGILNVNDKCTLDSRNAIAICDHDSDGYGNLCDADFDQNFAVNTIDFTMYFVPAFKGVDPAPWPFGFDMDCNNAVGAVDFTMFFVPKFKGALGGPIPGPSGLVCAGTAPCP